MDIGAAGQLSGVARHDYLPFAEELAAGAGGRTTVQGYSQPDGLRQQFTGHERDGETGLDYMKARYYSSSMGRFNSPDQLFADQWPDDPQSWNLYTYARNNPLRYTDPTGRGIWTKFSNWWNYGVWGEEEEVKAEEERRRAELQADSDAQKLNGFIVISGVDGAPDQARSISSLSRDEVWEYSNQLHEKSRTGKIAHDDALKLIQNVPASTGTTAQPTPTPPNVPQHAQDTLKHVESNNGSPPPGFKGGKPFLNDGRGGGQVLPKTDASGNPVTYREYDVNPYVKGVNRGAERIVRGSDGSAYYTADHYQTFTRIK